MYEPKNHPLISRRAFARRMLWHLAAVLLIVGGSLALGMLGYWHLEGHGWADAFMHTCFLLGGYGHLSTPQTVGGQVFFGFYGIYASLVFMASLGVLFMPVVHRLLHTFHLEESAEP